MPRQWCYLCQYPKEVPRGTQRLPPPIPPYFWGSGSGAQNEGPRDGGGRVDGEEKSRTRLLGPQVMAESVCEVCDAQVGHLDGTRPGTLCGRWAENAQRMLKWRQKSELSLVGWIRSRGEEGLARGWKWALPIGTVWAGPKAERAWPGLGVGPKRGGSWGGEGVGVRAGGVRRAGLTSGASRSEFALQHSWQVSAERKVPGARGSGTIRTCGDHAPRTWCGSVAAFRCPPGHGAREVRVSRPQRSPVSRRAEDRVGARSRARCLSGSKRERLGARWLRLCCCSPPCLQQFRRAPRARCSRACE